MPRRRHTPSAVPNHPSPEPPKIEHRLTRNSPHRRHSERRTLEQAFRSSLQALQEIERVGALAFLGEFVRAALSLAGAVNGSKGNQQACFQLGTTTNKVAIATYNRIYETTFRHDSGLESRIRELTRSLTELQERVVTLSKGSILRRVFGWRRDKAALTKLQKNAEIANEYARKMVLHPPSNVMYIRDDNVRKRFNSEAGHGQWRSDSRCLPKTRTRYINHILQWSTDAKSSSIFWLNGVAGSGKTTISQELAARLHADNGVYGCFFFDRKNADISPSAIQLLALYLSYIPLLQVFVTRAMERLHETHRMQTLVEQFEVLIVQPFREYISRQPSKCALLILDGVDLCPPTIRSDLLQALRQGVPHLPAGVKIFITSRPDVDVAASVALPVVQMPLAVGAGEDDGDVQRFLEHELRRMRASRALNTSWTDDEVARDAKVLFERGGGLFGWARTACSFLETTVSPHEYVAKMDTKASAHLDVLYKLAHHVD